MNYLQRIATFLVLILTAGAQASDPTYPLQLNATQSPVMFNVPFTYTKTDAQGQETTVTVNPHWFSISSWTVTNNGSSDAVVSAVQISVDLGPGDGLADCLVTLEAPVYVAPGKTESLPSNSYCERLRLRGNHEDFVYSGWAQLEGWLGTTDKPTGRLHTTGTEFKTQ